MAAILIPNITDLEELKALSVVVTSPETKAAAQEHLIRITKAQRQLAADIKTLKQPYKEQIDKIDAEARVWKSALDERANMIERAILTYNAQVKKAVEAANAKALERFEAKVDKAAVKAIETGKPMPVILPPAIQAAPLKTEKVDGGSVTIQKVRKWRIAGVAEPDTLTYAESVQCNRDIPSAYFVLYTAKINKVIKAGGTIPGVEVYDEEITVVRAAK